MRYHVHQFGPTGKPLRARDALPETLIRCAMLGLSMAVIVSPAGYGHDMAMLADVLSKYPDPLPRA